MSTAIGCGIISSQLIFLSHGKTSASWEFIIEHVDAFERVQAHVLRARLLAEQEQFADEAEAAQTALIFYQERGVDSVWSREAEELLRKAQAHQEGNGTTQKRLSLRGGEANEAIS